MRNNSSRLDLFSRRNFILLGLGIVVPIVVLGRFMRIVPVGSVGVLEQFGKVSDQILDPGFHLVSPFARVIEFSTQTQELKETTQTPSQDGLIITADVSILYRLDKSKAKEIYQTIGEDYSQKILLPQFRAAIRNATASYKSNEVYTTQRQQLNAQLKQEVGQTLAQRGILVEDTLLRNVQLPPEVQAAVQEKVQAEQANLKMDFVVQREKKESERKRIEAQGIADAQRTIAQGLSEPVLRFRQIEANEKLAASNNSKVIVLGEGKSQILLQP
jgi:regulator of protease activity HflC (stomatin/prohibitin superfamily)